MQKEKWKKKNQEKSLEAQIQNNVTPALNIQLVVFLLAKNHCKKNNEKHQSL